MKTNAMFKSLIFRSFGWVLVGMFICNSLYAQGQQVYLFGNLADVEDTADLFQKLEGLFQKEQNAFTLIVNGDLVNEKITQSNQEETLKPLFQLADLMAKFDNGQLIIVPGDRDWNNGKKGGEKSLENIEDHFIKYNKQKGYRRVHWAVEKGCPGPEIYEVGASLVIITLNTQWWNHPFDKPRPTDAICSGLSAENLKEELSDALDDYQDRNILIVGHHPLYSLGNYGGYFSLGNHFTPFPIVGLFTTSFHASAGNHNDLANKRLGAFISSMENLLYFHENLIYASGHEKNQQVINFGSNYLINSGAPTTARYAARNHRTIYSEKIAGIFRLSYHANGAVEADFLENTNAGLVKKSNFELYESSCEENEGGAGIPNTAWVPCKADTLATDKMQHKYTVPATIAAGPEYKANGFKRFWFGSHYRTSWTQPVEVPYLDLDETHGGLAIFKKGGGRQTTSLKFHAGNGTEYTFRSVNKNPTKTLNYELRQTIAADIVKDQTSTQQPYGAMVVAPLLDKIDILHVTPKLYRLPNDPKLGPFQAKYGGLLGMLEENPGKANLEGHFFGDADKIEKSVDLFKHFYKDHDVYLNTEEFVRARLFDIFIGDWSKHEDNWKWAVYKTDKGRLYRPIPRDRDHAFSLQDGFLNWLADRPFGIQNIENFGKKFTGIKSLTFQARHMDRFLMQEASKRIFMEQAKYIQDHISDEDIELAVRKMPPEMLELSGKTIEEKLKNRIRSLDQAAETYYGLLSKEVDVTGSREKEYFDIERQQDGSLRLRMFNVKNGQKGNKLLFDRTFIPSETKAVRIWGLGNEDIFEFSGQGTDGKIKVSTFGGPGDDIFKGESQARVFLYDKGKDTQYQVAGKAKIVEHWNSEIYEYDRQRYNANYFLPLISIGYSSYTGFGGTLSGNWTLRKFEKDDYASKHKVEIGLTTESNFKIGYSGRFHQTIRKWDFLVNAYAALPHAQNRFYGLGNSSLNQEDELGTDYYRAAVNIGHLAVGLARDFWQNSSFQVETGIEQNETDLKSQTFLDENKTSIPGATGKWTTIPAKVRLDIDFLDESGLPYNGARALLAYENNSVLSDVPSDNFGVATGFVEYFMSTRWSLPLTLGLRVGGATSHGDIPWFKLPTLGTNHGLRGYVQDRFVGKSMVYYNTELRFQLLNARTSIVPIKIGIKAFYDRARVFSDDKEESNEWRNGYGFGLYIVPLNESLTLALTFGFSDEESVYPVFSIGTPLR
ncbi:MAG: hypothetical protein DHS20C18_51410 [Saprospiraceae bacterium]|nr:MAG: hypothetical protein DHS20C18_51410 [Saprospiraceae bacterium]